MSEGATVRDRRPVHVHGGGEVLECGPAPSAAEAGLVLVHGRGGSPEDMLSLGRLLGADGVKMRAPRAAGGTWYPLSFLAPLADNEPGLSSGLLRLAEITAELEESGLARERQILLGFSQGACLALEFVARNPGRFGGVVGLSGGLIGPLGSARDYAGSLAGTPVFLGSSDPDPYVPWDRVRETAVVLGGMGAVVDIRRYPGMGHTVNEEEMAVARSLVTGVRDGAIEAGG